MTGSSLRARLLLSSALAIAFAAAPFASRPVLAQPAEPVSSGGLNTASLGALRLSLSLVPAPVGSLKTTLLGGEFSADTAVAFGLRPVLDYSLNRYLFIGFSPQLLFNVKGENADSAAKQLDLLVRVGGHAPVADNLHLYGYLAPGYSIIFPPEGNDNAKGFVLGVGAGAIYSFSGNLFAVADIGYQFGYQKYPVGDAEFDLKSSFLLIGLGVGVKL